MSSKYLNGKGGKQFSMTVCTPCPTLAKVGHSTYEMWNVNVDARTFLEPVFAFAFVSPFLVGFFAETLARLTTCVSNLEWSKLVFCCKFFCIRKFENTHQRKLISLIELYNPEFPNNTLGKLYFMNDFHIVLFH
jgi:hypothetical protein